MAREQTHALMRIMADPAAVKLLMANDVKGTVTRTIAQSK